MLKRLIKRIKDNIPATLVIISLVALFIEYTIYSIDEDNKEMMIITAEASTNQRIKCIENGSLDDRYIQYFIVEDTETGIEYIVIKYRNSGLTMHELKKGE